MDGRCLRAGLRGAAAHDREPLGPIRSPLRARDRPRGLRARLDPVGVRRFGEHADRHAGAHGHRRRVDHAGDAVDPHERVPGRGARPRDRHLGRRVRPGHRDRTDRRRLAPQSLLVGLGLPGERSRRDRRAGRRSHDRAELEGPVAERARPGGCGPVDRRTRQPGVRDHRGAVARVDLDADPGDARVLDRRAGGVRDLGAPERSPDARRHVLREPAVHRREHLDRARVLRAVRLAVLPDAVPAVRARLRRRCKPGSAWRRSRSS